MSWEKYKEIKIFERAFKEIAIDCALNRDGNLFEEELKKYKGCEKKGKCPMICDFQSCNFLMKIIFVCQFKLNHHTQKGKFSTHNIK